MVPDDIRVRRVASGDAHQLERFYANLTADSRVSRFYGARFGISHEEAERYAAADHRRRDGFVATANGRIVGHLVLEPLSPGIEELAVVVDDRVQHQGIGTLLLAAAVASARLRGIRRLVAWVRAENSAMRHLLTGGHHPVRLGWEGPVARYELEVPVDLPRGMAA
ncbi:MAG: GNAT family N-acetyltransferase [Chloroflexota bacterium]|nr:GNAT family N-acetyltransferase [Chloroflexota bacterium]